MQLGKTLKRPVVGARNAQYFFICRQASGAQIEKGELEKEILSLKSKLRILEHNYDLQTAALEEEKRKSAKLMVNRCIAEASHMPTCNTSLFTCRKTGAIA